jgi:hypothetical protein
LGRYDVLIGLTCVRGMVRSLNGRRGDRMVSATTDTQTFFRRHTPGEGNVRMEGSHWVEMMKKDYVRDEKEKDRSPQRMR